MPRRTKPRHEAARRRPVSPELPVLVPAPESPPPERAGPHPAAAADDDDGRSAAEGGRGDGASEPAAGVPAVASGVALPAAVAVDLDEWHDCAPPPWGTVDDLWPDVGEPVWAKYRGAYGPAIVTRVANGRGKGTGRTRRVVSYKFVGDLVMLKKARVFKATKRDSILPFTYEESQRQLREAKPENREHVQLSLEAVEAFLVSDDRNDPEFFFTSRCDYIVHLRSASVSPMKAAPPAPCFSPRLRGASWDGSGTDGDGSGADEDESGADEDESDADESPPPPPLPPLDEHQEAARREYAERLLCEVESGPVGEHLAAVHAGTVPSWRRDAFRRRQFLRLTCGSTAGDLTFYPHLAQAARKAVRRVVDELPSPPAVERTRYADEVMTPEAVLWAIRRLASEPRSASQLEDELGYGSTRFHA